MTFTTATLCASFILFKGFNTTDPVNTLSLLCGFLVTFTGVYLLNLSRSDPNGMRMLAGRGGADVTGTDMISSIQTRMSMEARHSMGSVRGHHRRVSSGTAGVGGSGDDREGLIRAYDDEEAAGFGLTDLAEESDDDHVDQPPHSPLMGPDGHHANGVGHGNGNGKVKGKSMELQPNKPSER